MSSTIATESVDAQPDSPVEGSSSRKSVLILSAILALVFLVGAWAAWFFTIDDAFISFRYAKNLAEGHGPVWNLTGQPVEGFTDFAWVVWNSVGSLLGIALPLFSKITSLVFGAATLAMLVAAGKRHAGLGGAAVAAGAFVLFIPTYFHITGGLETTAFAAVLLRIAVLGLRVLDGQRIRDWELPLLLLVIGMLRPEGVLAALPAFAVWLWHERRRVPPRWFTGAAVVIGAAYFVWRWRFYGQLLPNTFYIKFGDLASGRLWTTHTAMIFLPLLLLTAALIIRRTTRSAGLLLSSTVAVTYVTYAVSGPTMDYLDRFADHAFPVLCLGAGLAMKGLVPRTVAATAGVVAVAWVAIAGVTADDLPLISNYGPDTQRAHVPIGKGLALADVPPAQRTLAVSDAGAIPYYSGWNAIDYIGLNDTAISHGADPTTVVTTAHPTVVIITAPSDVIQPVRYGLRNFEAVVGYEEVASIQAREGYWENVFVLPAYADTVRTNVKAEVAKAQGANDPGRMEDTISRWLSRLRHELFG
jgi:arabinofuranosyltransferase